MHEENGFVPQLHDLSAMRTSSNSRCVPNVVLMLVLLSNVVSCCLTHLGRQFHSINGRTVILHHGGNLRLDLRRLVVFLPVLAEQGLVQRLVRSV